MPTGAGRRVSGFLLMPAICLTLEIRVSLSYTCSSLLPLLSSLGAEALPAWGLDFPLPVQRVGLDDLLGHAESRDWGMVGLPGDKDAVCAAPKGGAGQASQMCASPLIHQLLRLSPVLPPLFGGLLGQGKQTGKEC